MTRPLRIELAGGLYHGSCGTSIAYLLNLPFSARPDAEEEAVE